MKSIHDIRSRGHLQGFTLVEVLVATVCIAIIILALNSAIYTAMRLRTKTTEHVEKTVPVQHALTLMSRDMQGIMASNGTMAGSLTAGISLSTESSQAGTVQPGAIQFRTSTGVISDDEEVFWGDVQNVAYYLRQSTTNDDVPGMELVRGVTRNLLAVNTNDLTELPLLEGVKSLDYYFYDGTQWTNGWDSTTASPSMPQAIKLEITMMPEEDQTTVPAPFEITVPVLVQTRSNTVDSSSSESSGGGSQPSGSGSKTSGGGAQKIRSQS
jgi:type II secretion system protein J